MPSSSRWRRTAQVLGGLAVDERTQRSGRAGELSDGVGEEGVQLVPVAGAVDPVHLEDAGGVERDLARRVLHLDDGGHGASGRDGRDGARRWPGGRSRRRPSGSCPRPPGGR